LSLAPRNRRKRIYSHPAKNVQYSSMKILFCVFVLFATATAAGTGRDVWPGGVADFGPVKAHKSMHISDVVAMSGDANTRVAKLLTSIYNYMRYNASKEVLNEFADALMHEPCDRNVEDNNLSCVVVFSRKNKLTTHQLEHGIAKHYCCISHWNTEHH
jgi:hypothetical protein